MLDYTIIIEAIFPRHSPYYESPLYPKAFYFGDQVIGQRIIKQTGDFNYLEINSREKKLYLPLEYLIQSDIYKKYKLPLSSELKKLPDCFSVQPPYYVNNEAYHNLIDLLQHAAKDNISLKVAQGYLSIDELSISYRHQFEKEFLQNHCEKPFKSAYHSGFLIDFTSSEIDNNTHPLFYMTQAFEWLRRNSVKYQFYPFSKLENCQRKNIIWKPYQFIFKPLNKPQKSAFNNITISSLNHCLMFKKRYRFGAKTRFLFTHDNEHSARATSNYVINKYGGALFEILNNGKRNLTFNYHDYQIEIDPNRLFTQYGIQADLINQNPELPLNIMQAIVLQIQQLSIKWLKAFQLRSSDYMIALHTNNRKSDLDIYYFTQKSQNQSFLVHINPEHHRKNFFYTIHPVDFRYYKSQNFNVVLQLENKMIDDGSLSIWMHRHCGKYISIEVQEGYHRFQKYMLDKTMKWINNNNLIPVCSRDKKA